jgi:low temperature requirement protein LtrA
MRTEVLFLTISAVVSWAPLIFGALLGGIAQTLLWVAAFAIDNLGVLITDTFGGWQLRSPSHLVERYALVLNIALGESLVSVGAGARSTVTRQPVLVAALLGLTITACLWWLYFKNASAPAGQALGGDAANSAGRQPPARTASPTFS